MMKRNVCKKETFTTTKRALLKIFFYGQKLLVKYNFKKRLSRISLLACPALVR